MSWLKRVYFRLRGLLKRNSIEHDMDREMRLHLELLEDEYRRTGMQPEDAGLAARRRFGNLGQIKELGRDIRGAGFLDNLWRDFQYACRTFRGSPAFSAVVVLSVALGIGANTALFSVFDALFLRDLPVRNPHELVAFGWTSGPNPEAFVPRRIGYIESHGRGDGNGREVRTVFSAQFPSTVVKSFRETGKNVDVAAFAPVNTDAGIDGRSEEITAQVVSGNFFQTVGVAASAGRLITPEDDQPSASPAVVISHDFWKREFALDPSVVGKRILLSSVLPVTIVGVTAQGFHTGWGDSPDFSIPIAFMPQLAAERAQPDFWILGIVGRMHRGAGLDQVRDSLQDAFLSAGLEGIERRPGADVPRLLAIPGGQGFTPDYIRAAIGRAGSSSRFSLLMIVGAVFSLLLFIVCLNIANLLIARSENRRYEVGVRLAMGARRIRLIQQLLTESVLLALLGGSLGTLLAYWGKDLLRVFLQQNGQLALDLRIDLRLLGFSLGISILTGIVFGLLPAFRATRVDVHSAVKQSGRILGHARNRMGRPLLVAQVAMSLVLLIGAGLLIRTLGNLPQENVGYNVDNLLGFRVSRPILEGERGRYESMLERIRAIPGVTALTASFDPFVGTNASFTNGDFLAPANTAPMEVKTGTVRVFLIRPNFFEVMGIPVIRGRGFDSGDQGKGRRVAVITESLARQFPSDPIGWRFGGNGRPEVEVVGVVKNVGVSEIRTVGIMSEIHGTVFFPELQQDDPWPVSSAGFVNVRTTTNPLSLIPAIRAAVREIDPTLRAFEFATEAQLVEKKLAPTWRIALAWTLFGGLALVLTCIGLYGLLSYNVARRTNEIGIRLALGAGRFHVLRMIAGQTFFLVCAGILLGLVASLAINQTIRALIYGVTFYDPLVMAIAVAIMVGVVGTASFLPARRASRVDPTIALRWE